MTPVRDLALIFAGLAAVCAALLATALVLRSPRCPEFLKSEFAAQMVSVVLAAAFLFMMVDAGQALVAAGLDYFLAAAITVATAAVLIAVLWKVFRVGARLERFDTGH